MTSKTKNIVSIVLGALPSAMVLISGTMKLSGNPKMVEGLTQGGFGSYITLFGALEFIMVILFFIPKTKKVGFYLLCSYLGGAMAVELGVWRLCRLLLLPCTGYRCSLTTSRTFCLLQIIQTINLNKNKKWKQL